MSKNMKNYGTNPEADGLDAEVVQLRAQFDERAPLEKIVRQGAKRMLQ